MEVLDGISKKGVDLQNMKLCKNLKLSDAADLGI
jgi:hypothetical protein